uniref:Protein yippee-like n=1 Tax=Mantoniella antarctica TaxID=81844 RepID=A0A7S0SXB5_9CHLO|mmetsp:Transcript_33799/g.54235  ORF Transcript_33799/g.54235 Transcript_33799/m.54235 type:complete len:114 (-) Transcript_33799:427-768(-)
MAHPPVPKKLTGSRVYSCSFCRSHSAYHDDIVSKAFQGRHGRAYLFNDVTNITLGGKEDRMLMTGLHTVRDVFCTPCGNLMGWKYETAYETGQKYKEGKFIVEKAMVLHEGGW